MIKRALTLLLSLFLLIPLLSACSEAPVVGGIDDNATIAMLSYETFEDGIDGVVYRQVNRFSALMGQSEVPLLVVFYSPLSELNVQIIPKLESLAYEQNGRLKIVWIDGTAETNLAESFQVTDMPQFTIVVGASMKRSMIGYDDEGSSMLDELLDPYLTGSK